MRRTTTALIASIMVASVILGGFVPALQLAGTVSAAPAADLVVDDDNNDCATADHSTLQDAVDAATDGDIIRVCAGSYSSVDISKSVTLVGDSPDAVTISGGSAEDFGVNISASNVNLRNVTITGFQSAGVFIKQGGRNATVTLNYISSNGDDGVRVAQNTNTADIRIVRNRIEGNSGAGIDNRNGSEAVAGWLNYWGANTGPSSQTGGTVDDPKTGAPADGDGDRVTGDSETGSSVQFDPWVGKAPCSSEQMDNLVEQDALNNITRVCAWDRALLPLRVDSTDAGTSVPNMNVYVNGSGVTERVPANRQDLSVYNQGDTVTIDFTDVQSYANTDRFADEDGDNYAEDDVQLLVLEGTTTADVENLTFNQSSGEIEIPHGASSAEVRDDADGVGELDSSGDITTSYDLGTADAYTFALVRKKFGGGLGTNGANITIDGGVDVLGVEHIETQEAVGSASVNGPVTVGNNATFDVATNLPGETAHETTHSVIIYDQDKFTGASTTLEVDATLSDVLSGGLSSDQTTAYHSIESLNGIFRVDSSFTVFGIEIPSIVEQGQIPVSSFLSIESHPTSNTVLDSSASTTIVNSDTATVDVETFENFSTGTYQYVYVAQQHRDGGSRTSTTAGTFQVQSQSTGGGGQPPAGGGGGGGGGGDAPPRDEDQDDESVRVTDASLSDSSIAPGESVQVTGTIRNERQSSARFTVTLNVDGERVNSRTITVPAQSNHTVSFNRQFQEPGEYEISLNDVSAGTLTVGEPGTDTPSVDPGTDTPDDGTPTDTTDPGETPDDDGLDPIIIAIIVLILLCIIAAAAYFIFLV